MKLYSQAWSYIFFWLLLYSYFFWFCGQNLGPRGEYCREAQIRGETFLFLTKKRRKKIFTKYRLIKKITSTSISRSMKGTQAKSTMFSVNCWNTKFRALFCCCFKECEASGRQLSGASTTRGQCRCGLVWKTDEASSRSPFRQSRRHPCGGRLAAYLLHQLRQRSSSSLR